MPKWERATPFEHRKPRSDEQLAREVDYKRWNLPKSRPRSRVEYCDKCNTVHGKGRHVKK